MNVSLMFVFSGNFNSKLDYSIPTGRKWVDPLLIFAHVNYVTFLQNNEETGCNMEGGVNELEEIEEIELQ